MEPKMMRIYEHSFENSKRIIERNGEINKTIQDLLYSGFCESQKEATDRINKYLYETAEKMEISLYDLCFKTIPDYKIVATKDGIEAELSLKYVNLNLEQGPGYWKSKYYNLKKKMQKIIDNKEI